MTILTEPLIGQLLVKVRVLEEGSREKNREFVYRE
jgi:hypothetical protein